MLTCMHDVLHVCIRASRTAYAVVSESDVSMEDGLRKDQRHLASLFPSQVWDRANPTSSDNVIQS